MVITTPFISKCDELEGIFFPKILRKSQRPFFVTNWWYFSNRKMLVKMEAKSWTLKFWPSFLSPKCSQKMFCKCDHYWTMWMSWNLVEFIASWKHMNMKSTKCTRAKCNIGCKCEATSLQVASYNFKGLTSLLCNLKEPMNSQVCLSCNCFEKKLSFAWFKFEAQMCCMHIVTSYIIKFGAMSLATFFFH
jgi:hypothetical protein